MFTKLCNRLLSQTASLIVCILLTIMFMWCMSKLCKNEDEAKQTVEWYKQQYVLEKQPYDSPNYRKSPDGKYWVVYNESTNIAIGTS